MIDTVSPFGSKRGFLGKDKAVAPGYGISTSQADEHGS